MRLLSGRGLVEGSVVWLDCGGDQEFECVVLGFVGSALLLLPRRLPRPTTRVRLAQGALFAELLVEAGR